MQHTRFALVLILFVLVGCANPLSSSSTSAPITATAQPTETAMPTVMPFLRGQNPAITRGEGSTFSIGDTFRFNEMYVQSGPGPESTYIFTQIEGTLISAHIAIPKTTETTVGQAAIERLKTSAFTIAALGNVNNPIAPDSSIEFVLTDPNSSEPPYTVNFYRGTDANRTLVSTFTIETQK